MLHASRLSPAARAWAGLRHAELEDTVLATIINAKVERLARTPPPPSDPPPPPGPARSLYAAIRRPGRSFILECKRSSPSLGDFCPDFNLDLLIAQYAQYASAISVLCEQDYFRGELGYLTYVRERVDVPVLCKDFIICEQQLLAARHAGADAVLLMLSVLETQRFRELYARCCELGLEVLTEVSGRAEAEAALACGVPLVGINNRNLRSLTIDLGVTRELAPLLRQRTLVISESGIRTHADLLSLRGVDGYLIGSALCADPHNLNFNLKGLLYGFNKICGLRTTGALERTVANHLCFAGLIFVPHSPRCITAAAARSLIGDSRFRGRIRFVGVFADVPPGELAARLQELGVDYVQLHGSESPAYIEELRRLCPDVGIIKAVAVDGRAALERCAGYAPLCDFLLLDAGRAGQGQAFDHGLLGDYAYAERTLLAGGIGADNFTDAFDHGLAGVDLNSALESSRGVKDCALIDEVMGVINAY